VCDDEYNTMNKVEREIVQDLLLFNVPSGVVPAETDLLLSNMTTTIRANAQRVKGVFIFSTVLNDSNIKESEERKTILVFGYR
jgi:hypothetical protein